MDTVILRKIDDHVKKAKYALDYANQTAIDKSGPLAALAIANLMMANELREHS